MNERHLVKQGGSTASAHLQGVQPDDRDYSGLLGAHLVKLHAITKDIETSPHSTNY